MGLGATALRACLLRSRLAGPGDEVNVPTLNEKAPDQARILAAPSVACRVRLDEMARLFGQERTAMTSGANVTMCLVEQCAAAAKTLSQQAEHLVQSVAVFQLDHA